MRQSKLDAAGGRRSLQSSTVMMPPVLALGIVVIQRNMEPGKIFR